MNKSKLDKINKAVNSVYIYERKLSISLKALSSLLTEQVEVEGLALDATILDGDGIAVIPVQLDDAEFNLRDDNTTINIMEVIKTLPIKDINDLPTPF